MKIVFFGTPEFAVPTLSSLLSHPEFEVVAVVTQPDKTPGKRQSVDGFTGKNGGFKSPDPGFAAAAN
jgi:methionyl-tRNA formyltransferase (EC 2.1.2.9)